MTQHTYDGYRFEHSRQDASAPDGKLTMHIIAVAGSEKAARDAAAEIVGSSDGLTLIESGSVVLAEARYRGIGDGLAVVL